MTNPFAALPPPDDGVCYLVVDRTLKGKTGRKHPLAKKGRLNEYAPYIGLGLRAYRPVRVGLGEGADPSGRLLCTWLHA